MTASAEKQRKRSNAKFGILSMMKLGLYLGGHAVDNNIESICIEISQSCESVLGIGIGGSVGERTFDDLSDWDIFVFCKKADLEAVILSADSIWTKKLNPCLLRKGDYYPDFGYRNAYITHDTQLVECFFLPIELVQPNPMLSKTRLIFDRNGAIGELIANKSGDAKIILALMREYIAFEFINCSHKIRRAFVRNDVYQATQKLGMIRGVFFTAVLFVDSGELVHPHDADKGLGGKLSKDALSLVERSFPQPRLNKIAEAYKVMRASILLFLVSSSESSGDQMIDLVEKYAADIGERV